MHLKVHVNRQKRLALIGETPQKNSIFE